MFLFCRSHTHLDLEYECSVCCPLIFFKQTEQNLANAIPTVMGAAMFDFRILIIRDNSKMLP